MEEPVYNPAGTVSVQIAQAMAFDAARRGLDLAPVLREAGVRDEVLADVDGRLGPHVAVQLWRRVVELTGDPCYGLHLAEVITEGAALTLGGHMMLASRSVRDAMARVLRLERVFHDLKTSVHVLDSTGLRVRIRTKDDPIPVPAVAVHCVWAFAVLLERKATGVHIKPASVAFEHPPPGADPDDGGVRREFERVLGVAPTFEADANELVFSAEDLDRPHLSANLQLSAILERHAEAVLEKLPRGDRTLVSARQHVLSLLVAGEEPTLALVARALGTSERTLQRRLGALGTSHVAVVDEARKELGLRYVGDRSLPLVEIAYALGFSDQTAFHRAFQRWTGSPPGAYRKRLVAG